MFSLSLCTSACIPLWLSPDTGKHTQWRENTAAQLLTFDRVAGGTNATAWALGAAAIANGLSAGEACGAVLIGSVIAGMVAFTCGEPGVSHAVSYHDTLLMMEKVIYHLGFPMMSRSTFGMYGSYFVIMMKTFVNIILYVSREFLLPVPLLTVCSCGIQCYWGGLAVTVILSSIFPSFAFMTNSLPVDAAISSAQLIGYMIYFVIFSGLLFIHPSKLQPLLFIAFVGVSGTFIGLFAFCIGANGGSASLIAPTKVIDST